MTRVHRILRKLYAKRPFDGEGAFRFGGRWSSPGVRMVYTSQHLSLAMIEYFVHIDPGDLPPDLVVAVADVPESVPRERVAIKDLPEDWRTTPAPPQLAMIGDAFAREGRAAILIVPSALAPEESNWLINPQHRSFARLRLHPVKFFQYDPRFFDNRS